MHSRIILGLLSLVLAQSLFAGETLSVKNNAEFSLGLSQSNYNRLLIKGDKILDLSFPENAMGIKRDELDGSVYISLGTADPFTLFVTTEAGRHFTVTISGEKSLGKTIELVPTMAVVQTQPLKSISMVTSKVDDEKTLVSLINHMEINQPLEGFTVGKRSYVEHWKDGFTLTHTQVWQGSELTGEIVKLYNGGYKPFSLDEAWFNQDKTRALKLSQKELFPRQTAYLYRVTGENHG